MIAHLTFACTDIEPSAEFMQAVLGWKRLPVPANCDVPVAWMEIAPGQELHLITVDDFAPSAFEQEYGRHLAVFFPADEIGQIKKRLADRQVEIIPPLRPTPHERFFFREPAGYMLEVINQDEFQPLS